MCLPPPSLYKDILFLHISYAWHCCTRKVTSFMVLMLSFFLAPVYPSTSHEEEKNISVNSLTNFLNLKRLSHSIFPSLMMKKSWRSAAEPESSRIIIALSTHNAVLVCVSSKRRLPVSSIPLSLVNLVRILCILF